MRNKCAATAEWSRRQNRNSYATRTECAIDVMSRLILKYGPDMLEKIEREKWKKVQEAHCEETCNML